MRKQKVTTLSGSFSATRRMNPQTQCESGKKIAAISIPIE
jgi:hypothetical protein